MNGRARPEIPVIAFHALGLDRHSFAPLRGSLHDGRQLVAFDLLGPGSNRDRASESLEDHAQYAAWGILRVADGTVSLLRPTYGRVIEAHASQETPIGLGESRARVGEEREIALGEE